MSDAPFLAGLRGESGERFYQVGKSLPLDPDETAYDGSSRSQERELTARERDVLCRLLTFGMNDRYFRGEETHTYGVILQVLNPRED